MTPSTHAAHGGPSAAQGGADAVGGTRMLLRMAVGQDVLAVPIDDVREILQVTRLTPLPRTPGFVRGVMNLRGAVVPVIDLGARLGGAATVVGRRSCIVVVDCAISAADEAHDDNGDLLQPFVVGLLVDAVFEVFDRNADDIEAVPPIGTRIAAHCLLGMTRSHGEVIGVLALDRILARHELTAAIASFQPH